MKFKILAMIALLAVSACTTTFDSNKVDYKSKGVVALPLEVPPDLTQITKNVQAAVPIGGAANASSFNRAIGQQAAGSAALGSAVATNTIGDVRVQREGTQRWLVVGRAPDKLWEDVKAFWADSGFTLVIDQANLGIMETEWNENRAKIPQDGIRRLLSKVFDNAYSTNQRDKYRTRMERTASGDTEIYISHRGMVEDFTSASDRTQFLWKPSPVDPEMEVEFLKRLMVRLGGSQGAADAALGSTPANSPSAPASSRALIVQEGEQVSMLVSDSLDQAWRRVGLSLDRTNFTVEDRDRSKGIYFVRYVEPDADKNAPGFFARMFGAKAKEGLQRYQVVLTAQSEKTRVQVATVSGQVLGSADARAILKVLSDDLK